MAQNDDSHLTTHEKLTTHNVLKTEALFELLVEKGILSKAEVTERIARLKKITKHMIRRIN